MYCEHCGHSILADAKFCSRCGYEVQTIETFMPGMDELSLEPEKYNQNANQNANQNQNQTETESNSINDIEIIIETEPNKKNQPRLQIEKLQTEKLQTEKPLSLGNIANKINRVAGINTPIQIKLKEVFSKVFVKHSEEEAENLFFVGTSQTTPNIENVMDNWPKPWLFARIFIVVGLLYFGLFLGVEEFRNLNFLPGLITLGSFMVPITILIFFWEMNAPQNISIYKIIKILFIGGLLSLFLAVLIFENIISGVSVFIIGIVEEVAKLLVILWFLKDRRYSYILNGLLIGAAVGTGFAAFESAGYALQMALFNNLDRMYSTIFWRGVLSPGGHIVWAALSGAAICIVKGKSAFKWSMLKDLRFLRIFAIVVVLHALWNIPWFMVKNIPIAQLIFTALSWVFALGVMNFGLKEISQLKEQHAQQTTDIEPIHVDQPNLPI